VSTWPIPHYITCSFPLYLYYKFLKKIGQSTVAQELEGLMKHIDMQCTAYFRSTTTPAEQRRNASDYADDYWRHKLKTVSAFCFPKVFIEGPAYMLFVHLHTLTAKSPFTKQQIYDDIDSWVSECRADGSKKDLDRETTEKVLDRIFVEWTNFEADGFLELGEYCNDYMRWGTSGGASKVERDGSKYRTKWTWEISTPQRRTAR